MKTRFFTCLLLLPMSLWANNLQISNVSVVSTNQADQYSIIQFDISWENSWRDAENRDAAWLFLKYRLQGSTAAWSHGTIHTSGFTAPLGASVQVSADGMGLFIYRSGNGSGTINFAGAQIRWNYGVDGLPNGSSIDLSLLGMEMVYVPQGNYWLGDGENRPGLEIFGNFEAGTTGQAFQVTGEGAITLGGGSPGSLGNNNEENMYCCGGELGGAGDDFDDLSSQTLPAAFPKGFEAFYCMKYELSQAQYVDFINMLDATQAAFHLVTTHFVGSPNPFSYYRYEINGTHPNHTTAHPYAPMIYLSWIYAAAYADWAGLRPMTEMEFEKACRGPSVPVMGEYPWGTDSMDTADMLLLSNLGSTNEGVSAGYTATSGVGNCWVDDQGQNNIEYVSRIGIFAAHASNTGRETSGATYWGIMDMGGNAWERCVSVGHPQGRAFAGGHGDGELHSSGRANVADWPGQFGNNYVESNLGVGYRGAGMAFPNPALRRNARISSRRLSSEYWNVVLYDDSMRFVRNEP